MAASIKRNPADHRPTHPYEEQKWKPQVRTQSIKDGCKHKERSGPAKDDQGLAREESKDHATASRGDDHFHRTDMALGLHGHDSAKRDRWCQTREEQKQSRTNAFGVKTIAEITEVVRPATSHVRPAIHRRACLCRSSLRLALPLFRVQAWFAQ